MVDLTENTTFKRYVLFRGKYTEKWKCGTRRMNAVADPGGQVNFSLEEKLFIFFFLFFFIIL